MSLSIIIVNYKTPELLINCLHSVYKQTRDIDFEVIVVDNNSQDESQKKIISLFPQVIWLQLDYNAGFARANNAGIRISSGDAVLLLNSDTINVENAIADCYRKFYSSPFIACGVQLLNYDGTPQISGNHFMPGSLNNLLPLPYVGNILKWLGIVFKIDKPHLPDSQNEVEVDWINGAFLMVKKSTFEKAGLMDEDFFLYAEEAEWCWRLKKTGRLVIYGQYKLIHLQGATSNTAFKSEGKGYYNLYDRKGLQIMLSNFVRIRKQIGSGWFLFHLIVYTFTIPVIFISDLFRIIFTFRNPQPYLTRLRGFTTNVIKVWSYFWIILRNRPFFYRIL